MVTSEAEAGGDLNARLGKAIENQRLARAWKGFWRILIGVALILTIALVTGLIFLPIS